MEFNLDEQKYTKYVDDIQNAVLKINTTALQVLRACIAVGSLCKYDDDLHIDGVSFIAKQLGTRIGACGNIGWEELRSDQPANSAMACKIFAELIEARALPEGQLSKLSDPIATAQKMRTECRTIKAMKAALSEFKNELGSFDDEMTEFILVLYKALGYWSRVCAPKEKITKLTPLSEQKTDK